MVKDKKMSGVNIKKLFGQKKILIIAVILIAVLFTGFNIFAEKKPPEGMEASANIVAVETEAVKLTNSLGGLIYKANLQPAEAAAVSSGTSGQVTQVSFENGDIVSQGQPLAYLDDKDLQNQLRTAQIDLSKLELSLDSAKSDYDIASQLYAEGACSKTSYETAMRAYKTAQANVQLKQVSIQDITNSLNDCVIKAPIAGEISGKNISVGQYLNPGAVIATVNNNKTIKAEIQLMQEDLGKVTAGQEVILRLDKNAGTEYKGIVETIAASANSQTRAFDCLVRVDNASGALNSGTFGYVEILSQDKTQVLAVPMKAVAGTEGNYSVFTIENDTARRVSVTIGEISEDMIEITSGLQEGDELIVTNLNSLQDGDQVTVIGEGK
ncbi:MAG: family efflux transporter, subunit [Bacillota bacterium]|nr:family efflux transporter, subunit [Bacillota bacterium]